MRKSEIQLHFYSEIMANMSEGVNLVRASDGIIVYANPMFEKMFNYDQNELIGKHISIVNAPTRKSPEETADEIIVSLNKNGMWQGEVQNIKKDGAPFWCHASVSTFDDPEKGKVFVAVHTNITERKKADEALRDSEKRYRDMFENANDLIQSVLPDGRIKYVNNAWKKTLGYSDEEIKKILLFDIIHPASQSHCMEIFKRVMSGEEIEKVEAVFVTKDGRDIIVEGSVNCKFKAGKPVVTMGIFRDVTDRKTVEKQLEMSEETYRNIAENSSFGICTYDKSGQCVIANQSAADIIGATIEQILSQNINELTSWKKSGLLKTAKKALEDGEKKIKTVHIVSSFDKDIWLNCTLVPYYERNDRFLMLLFEDITKRKQAEEKIKNSEERLKILFKNTPETVYLMDLKGTFIDFNKAAERLSGYTREEAIGKDFINLNLFSPIQVPKVLMLLAQVAMGKPVGPEELTLKNKDGIDVALEIRAYPVTIDNKKLLLGVASDITKRKSMEEMLKTAKNESEARVKLRTAELAESNVALKVLLKQREEDQKDFEHNIISNVRHLVLPYLTKLKRNKPSSEELTYLNIIESNLQEIVAPFSQKLSSKYLSFTHKEIQVANLIKDGGQDKDIMEILSISLDTVKTHRRNIRKKLGINNKKINLRTRLLSLP